ncbi:MAG: 4Fe-4S binding protein, partial [Deltaproteobacteria bacterium]|nr:4Fe-4S binding protein [Deltaproteobacteria bacterium]
MSLLCFLWLLWTMRAAPGAGAPDWLPPDLYVRLDPLAAFVLPAAARDFVSTLLPGLGVLLLAVLFGRIFCGYLCPFGATLDLVRFLGAKSKNLDARTRDGNDGRARPWHWGKYLLLIAIVMAAALGVNAVFAASPIPLITRFYATCVFPLVQLAGKQGLDVLRPVADALHLNALAYVQMPVRRFEAIFFTLFFFGA